MVKDVIYNRRNVVSFSRIKGEWGLFSNMSYSPLFVNETLIPSAEALYQVCKYPLFPNIQREIINQDNGMKAKLASRKYQSYVRQDWEMYKYSIMRWTLMVKLMQDWEKMSSLLMRTDGKDIVEYSTKDPVWGAVPCGSNSIAGRNILGRLLMDIRDNIVIPNRKPEFIPPLNIPSFQLLGSNIGRVYAPEYYDDFLESP